MSDASRVLVARVDLIGGQTRFVLVGVGRIDGAHLVADTMVGGMQSPLEGVRASGRYVFVEVDGAIGFAQGVVRGTNGQPFGGALITNTSVGVVSLSNPTGAHLSVGRVGNVPFTATDLAKNDSGTAPGFMVANTVLPVSLRLVAQPPTITSTTPTNDATNVALTDAIVVTFSEPIDPASVAGGNIANVKLAGPDGVRLDGAVALSANNTVLTFRSADALAENTAYRFTLFAGITDMAGYALAETTIQFESLDTTPPPTPPAGSITASIPNATGFTTVSATQGTASPTDRVFIDNVTRKTTTVALIEPNGGFITMIAAGITDVIRVRIVDANGNEIVQQLEAYKQTNADGSVSQAVGKDGGVVEGPQGLRATIKAGTFPDGAVVTLNRLEAAAIPVTFTPAQAEYFETVAGFAIDFGGATPQLYLDISIPAGPGDSATDQWLVGQVIEFGTETVFEMTDTAKFRDGRITTASPPCPGVTAAGVYGLTKAKQTYGLNYAEMYAEGRYTLNAKFELYQGVSATIPIPYYLFSAELPKKVCFPAITGRVTVVPNTTRLTVPGVELTPSDREILVTNTTLGSTVVSYPRQVPDFVLDNPWAGQPGFNPDNTFRAVARAGNVSQRVPVYIDLVNGQFKFVVRADSVAVPTTSIELTDLTQQQTASIAVEPGDFEVSVTGGASDTFVVQAVPRLSLLLSTEGLPGRVPDDARRQFDDHALGVRTGQPRPAGAEGDD